METFSALLAICAGNSPVPGEFPTQRPVTRSFDVFFDLRPNERLGKQRHRAHYDVIVMELTSIKWVKLLDNNDYTLMRSQRVLIALTHSDLNKMAGVMLR